MSRKKEILGVARRLFLTKDYEQTTMLDIMNTLKIAKGTIYHYFKSKEALFEAVVEDIVEENVEQMRSLVERSTGGALEKLERLVEAGNISGENEKIVEQLHKPASDALHSRLLGAIIMNQAPLYAQVIEQGCQEGVFSTEKPLECAEFILSAVQFLTDVGIYPWPKEVLRRRMDAFPPLIEQLLKAPPGSFQFLLDRMQSE